MKTKTLTVIIIVFLCSVQLTIGQISIPKFFSSHMVLQRDEVITIFGNASPDETIKLTFKGTTNSTKADTYGKWKIQLNPMKAGGPYTMEIKGVNTISLTDIYIGDVWFCSGQSNMGWKMQNVLNAETELANANIPEIKLLNVYRYMSSTPKDDMLKGEWETSTTESVKDFSAVAYFFGKNLYEEYHVPIGLINSSWGGTNIEAWMPAKGFIGNSDKQATLRKMQGKDLLQVVKDYKVAVKAYDALLDDSDLGTHENWYTTTTNYNNWKSFTLPSLWQNTELKQTFGVVWVSQTIALTQADLTTDLQLSIGRVDNEDITYFNGIKVGESKQKDLDRIYTVDKNILQAGFNRITIRTKNQLDLGGFRGAASDLYLQTATRKISLANEWQYKVGTPNTQEPPFREHPNVYPSCLYNSMVTPFFNFPVKGIIWYQGESNAKNPEEYATYFPVMINSWREGWGKQLPFLYVQLANYDNQKERWPWIREAQATALKLPKTAMTVAIDVGNDANIHPINKQIIGKRLAIAAQHIAYGNTSKAKGGPELKKVKVKKESIEIVFDTSLLIKGNANNINGFELSANGTEFVKANARQTGSKTITVTASEVSKPKYVRYLWKDAPGEVMLYNEQELPIAPFRTDKK